MDINLNLKSYHKIVRNTFIHYDFYLLDSERKLNTKDSIKANYHFLKQTTNASNQTLTATKIEERTSD